MFPFLMISRDAFLRILGVLFTVTSKSVYFICYFHLRDNCVLSKEFYPTQYLRPGCLIMTLNSVTFCAVFSACSTKKIACEYSQFLAETFRSNDFRNKTPVRTKLKQ